MRESSCASKAGLALGSVQETKRQYLERLKKDLLGRIEDIDRAIVLLDKNQDIEELLNLLQRV